MKNQNSSLGSFLFLLTLLLFLSSCRPKLIPQTFAGWKEGSTQELYGVLERLSQSEKQVRSMRVLLDGVAHEGVTKSGFQQRVVFHRPEQLRLEIFGTSMNRLTNIIVANGSQIKALDIEKSLGYQGQANRENIAKLLPLPISLEQAMLWFAGRFFPPVDGRFMKGTLLKSPDAKRTMVELLYNDDRLYRLTLANSPAMELLAIEERTFLEDQVLFYTEYQYDDAKRNASELLVPHQIQLSIPQSGFFLQLTLKQSVLNPSLSDKDLERLFEFRFQEGIDIQDLDRVQEKQRGSDHH